LDLGGPPLRALKKNDSLMIPYPPNTYVLLKRSLRCFSNLLLLSCAARIMISDFSRKVLRFIPNKKVKLRPRESKSPKGKVFKKQVKLLFEIKKLRFRNRRSKPIYGCKSSFQTRVRPMPQI